MHTELPQSVIERYQRDGFVHVPQFLSAEEVRELKVAVEEAVAALGNRKVADGNPTDVEQDRYYDHVFTQRLNLWRLSATVKKYMLNPKLGELLCRLEGLEGVRCWHDQALIKQPFANPTAWHLDNPYWSFTSRQSLSIWIALEDATLHNGCMWFVPGTHRLARSENAGIGQNMGDLFRLYPEMAQTDPVPVPMKAGDCSFHNGLTAHGAGANMTRGTRMAMTCAYMPQGATFNGQANILPKAYLKTLKPGDLLENDDWNPRIWPATPRGNAAAPERAAMTTS